jgi:predicted amidohydrolase YtcJ
MRKTLYRNGTILTAADAAPFASEVFVVDGIIEEVAAPGDELSHARNADARIVDLQGKVLVPGFIDGHSHFLGNAFESLKMNAKPSPLGESDSIEGLIESLKKQIEEPKFAEEECLYASGYDEAVYPEHRVPNRYDLDMVTDKPLALSHVSGHNAVFNSAALKYAGFGKNYKPPSGGSAGRFKDGTLTGVFYENAMLDVALPRMCINERKVLEEGIETVVLQYVSKGVTTAQDGMTSSERYGYGKCLAASGKLPIDVVAYIHETRDIPEDILKTEEPWQSEYENHFRPAGIKVFFDGSPQAKTAWLSKPYAIPPDNATQDYAGYGIHSDEEVAGIFEKAVQNHWQINAHTNGDEAIEQFIRVYRGALLKIGSETDLRPVSIHCQTVREDQLDRMKELGILASFFVDHVYYWGDYHWDSVLGAERASRISPLKSALKRGISFSLHQDTPVAKQDPIFAVHNAVNRKTRSGKTLGEEFRIAPWEALKAVTINAAYQIFEEHKKGSIVPGKRADFAVLSDNPLSVPSEKIKDIVVLETIKDGVRVFKR